ncbi:hypothetical protein [Streptomyces mangrovisoli]|nr:hypothetical protein [Streptomyces mangrovisoli]
MCAGVLTLAALVTGYVVLTAHMVEPDGPWDRQAVMQQMTRPPLVP